MFTSLVLVAVGTLAWSTPVLGTTTDEPQLSGSLQLTTEQKVGESFSPRTTVKDPFRGLFAPVGFTAETRGREQGTVHTIADPGYSVVCGTVIFKLDSQLDARIRKPVPHGNVWYAIRVVPAPACR